MVFCVSICDAACCLGDSRFHICTRNCDDVAAAGIKAAGESFDDKWKPVNAYDANKGKADESGDFPKHPARKAP